jgi:hypothetical protein
MKIVQTFWTGPIVSDNPLGIKAGWLSAEYHWMAWALSCLQLKKLYGRVELVTDNLGKEILVDKLGLPYDNVSTQLEGSLNDYPPELWSLAKISAFAAQQEPFLHFDGDCFIWQRLDNELVEAGLVAQNVEENLSYYRDMMADMEKKGWQMPPLLQGVSRAPTIYAANTGVFGGHNIALIQRYCQAAFDFVNSNRAIIPLTQKNQLNFIFEQCLLYYLAKAEGQPIAYLMNEPVTEPHYSDYARFVDVPEVTLIHTVGGYKMMPFTCGHLARRLRNDFPEWYYRIIALCGGLGLHSRIYQVPPFNRPDFYPALYVQLMQQYATDTLRPKALAASQLLATANGPRFEEAFGRTLYVLPGHSDYASLRQGVQAATGLLGELATELLDLESHYYLLQLQMADPVFVQYLYCQATYQYRRIDQLFTGPATELMAAKVQVSADVRWLQYHYNLSFDPADSVDMADLLDQDSPGTQAVLMGDWESGEVAELYADTMDGAVLDNCPKPLSIDQLLMAMRTYFDPEEIADDYEAYKKLILDTVKQQLLNGWLTIE